MIDFGITKDREDLRLKVTGPRVKQRGAAASLISLFN